MSKLISKLINRETILYIIFGVLTTIADFAVFGLLHYTADINEIIANTVAWVAAVAFAFITNKLFVFSSKSFGTKSLLKEICTFVSARLLTLILTDIFLIFARSISMNLMLAKALISVAVIILNYIFSKLFIFKKNNN